MWIVTADGDFVNTAHVEWIADYDGEDCRRLSIDAQMVSGKTVELYCRWVPAQYLDEEHRDIEDEVAGAKALVKEWLAIPPDERLPLLDLAAVWRGHFLERLDDTP